LEGATGAVGAGAASSLRSPSLVRILLKKFMVNPFDDMNVIKVISQITLVDDDSIITCHTQDARKWTR
jgi:hypothetical protein